MAANGDRKSTGSNFGCTLRCGFSCQSFSQSSSDGTVTSAFAKATTGQVGAQPSQPTWCLCSTRFLLSWLACQPKLACERRLEARVGIDQNPSLRYLPRNSLNDTRNPVTPSVAKVFCVSRKICQYPFTSRPLSFHNFPVSFCWRCKSKNRRPEAAA